LSYAWQQLKRFKLIKRLSAICVWSLFGMAGSLDKAHIQQIEKFNELIDELGKTRQAITELQKVIVNLDKQNYRLQIVGVIITSILGSIGAVDIILQILQLW
jgi:hypothetical protein